MKNMMPAAMPRRQPGEVFPHSPAPGNSDVAGARSLPCLDRWEILDLVKTARHVLQIGDREISVLSAHLSTLPKGPLDRNAPNLSFMEVKKLLQRANCMEERTFRRGEERLVEVGLIKRKLSANGRRFPRRDVHGMITDGYGVDLSPLLGRVEEVAEIAREAVRETALKRDLISELRARLADAARLARTSGADVLDWVEERGNEIRKRLRRKSSSLDDLSALRHATEAVFAAVTQASRQPPRQPDPEADASVETRDTGAGKDLGALSKTPAPPDTSAADAGQIDRHIEPRRKEDTVGLGERQLRNELETSWARTKIISSFFERPPRTAEELRDVLQGFSRSLGMNGTVLTEAIASLGIGRTIKALDYIAERIDTIANASGYMLSIARAQKAAGPHKDRDLAWRRSASPR
ncbi:helix-turn-helix domain-containing protein [Jannaschia formosa]|uniref:helix-turn-helix domain-containing protein n=1 Tax=Jannaschia formosa TaxID=2259592 RepID=UPI000E1C08CC|nr:helix-turn-helix domain-containing protein [Jannaschia formosa]TFL16033.1 hypothetical protein DR046_22160 [Jannaschia formosa]